MMVINHDLSNIMIIGGEVNPGCSTNITFSC